VGASVFYRSVELVMLFALLVACVAAAIIGPPEE